jgi:RecJ-like exonuclease
MKRRGFVASLSALAVGSCARMDQRSKRYDPKECPFCSVKPGECSYCKGSTKCVYCDGTGKRKTTTEDYPDPAIKEVTIEEECPYCKGSGSCRYCDGVGKCWACKGTGEIESWDFYSKYKAREEGKDPGSSQ